MLFKPYSNSTSRQRKEYETSPRGAVPCLPDALLDKDSQRFQRQDAAGPGSSLLNRTNLYTPVPDPMGGHRQVTYMYTQLYVSHLNYTN